MKGTQNSRSFQYGHCTSSDNPSIHWKRETELMVKVNLNQIRLSHVPESHNLPECTNKPRFEGT